MLNQIFPFSLPYLRLFWVQQNLSRRTDVFFFLCFVGNPPRLLPLLFSAAPSHDVYWCCFARANPHLHIPASCPKMPSFKLKHFVFTWFFQRNIYYSLYWLLLFSFFADFFIISLFLYFFAYLYHLLDIFSSFKDFYLPSTFGHPEREIYVSTWSNISIRIQNSLFFFF